MREEGLFSHFTAYPGRWFHLLQSTDLRKVQHKFAKKNKNDQTSVGLFTSPKLILLLLLLILFFGVSVIPVNNTDTSK